MLKHCDRIAYLAVPVFLLLLLVLGISAPYNPAPPPPPPSQKRPVLVEIIREDPTPEPEPIPEPEPEPEPKPVEEPKPAPPEPAEPEPVPEPEPEPVIEPQPTTKDEVGEDNDGALPPLHADYRRRVGFRRYVEGLRLAGADFFITGAKQGTLLQIDFASGDLVEVAISRLANRGYSPRTRVISDEPELDAIVKRARETYKVPNPKVLMLVPAKLEAQLASALRSGLHMKLSDISSLKGEYFLQNGRLHLKITHVYSVNGNKAVDLIVRIG